MDHLLSKEIGQVVLSRCDRATCSVKPSGPRTGASEVPARPLEELSGSISVNGATCD